MLFDSSLGIDFRQNHLILTFLKESFGKIKLVDYTIHPLPPDSQKEDRETQVINLVNTFASRHQVRKDRVSISIPREKVAVRLLRFPIATKENLRKVVEYETSKYTPFEKGEVYFDYHLLKQETEWLHLFVVFVKKAEVDYYLSLLKKIGILPISIQIPSSAALNLFFYNEGNKGKEEEISVLVDAEDPFWEINLVREKHLAESVHLPMPRDKREHSLINTLKRSGLKEGTLSKTTLFVYGFDADEELLASLRESNGLKGVLFPSLNRIEAAKTISSPYKIYSSIGVPLKGLTKTQVDLNLLPAEMHKKVRRIRKPVSIILACFLLMVGVIWGVEWLTQFRNDLDVVNAEIKKRKPEVEAIERLQKQKEDVRKELSGIAKIRDGEISKVEILRELTQLLPGTVWIWNFKYANREVEINGFADSASDLIPLLDRSPLFEKVEFASPVTTERVITGKESREKQRFKIKMRLEARKS